LFTDIRALVHALTIDRRALESHWARLRAVLLQLAAGTALPLASKEGEAFVADEDFGVARA